MKFTISIPTWIQGVRSEGENVVMYRVNVILEDSPPGPPFFVMRRYSQFRALYDKLKEKHPEAMHDPSLLPPPKHAQLVLPGLGSKETALDRRREDLERWMWNLLSKPDLARSPFLRSFLEVDRALIRLGLQQALPPASPLSHTHTHAHMPGDSSPFPSSSSQQDMNMDRAMGSSQAQGQGQIHPHSLFDDSRSDTYTHSSNISAGPPHPHPPPHPHSTPAKRLVLKLESRGDVKKLVEALEQRLARASSDMTQASSEFLLLRESNKMMTQRMVEMEEEIKRLKSTPSEPPPSPPPPPPPPPPPLPPPPAAPLMEDMNRALSEIEEQLSASEEIRMDLSTRLAASESRVPEAEACAANATSRADLLSHQILSLQCQLSEAHADNKELLSRIKEWRIDGPSATVIDDKAVEGPSASEPRVVSDREEILEVECAALTSRCSELISELEALREKSSKEKDKVRSDQMTLAKGIKKLRAELEQTKTALDQTSPMGLSTQGGEMNDEVNKKLQAEIQASLSESLSLREKMALTEQELMTLRESIETSRKGEAESTQVAEGLGEIIRSLTVERNRYRSEAEEYRLLLEQAEGRSQALASRLTLSEEKVANLLSELQESTSKPNPPSPSVASLSIHEEDDVLDLSGLTIYEPRTPPINTAPAPQSNEVELLASFLALFDTHVKSLLCEALDEAEAVLNALRDCERRASSVSSNIGQGWGDSHLLDSALASFSDIGASLASAKEAAVKLAVVSQSVEGDTGSLVRSPSPLLLLIDDEDESESKRKIEEEINLRRKDKIRGSILTKASTELRRLLSETMTDLAERETQLNDQRVEAILNAIVNVASSQNQDAQPQPHWFTAPPTSYQPYQAYNPGAAAPPLMSSAAASGPLAGLAEQLNQWRRRQ